MSARYSETMFTPHVKQVQSTQGSRNAYARQETARTEPDLLTANEIGFITARDSFYMATVSETGWPYVQHRGGPAGFVHASDPGTLAFADFRGNRQYISLGNIETNDRAALFFMDYPSRTRLKLIGRLSTGPASEQNDLPATLAARVERTITFQVEAYDWNCSQYITPRHTHATIVPVIDSLKARIAELEGLLAAKV